MDNTRIIEVCTQLQSISCYATTCVATQPIPTHTVLNIHEGISTVAQQISDINPPISKHLVDLKNALFTEIPYRGFYINPIAYGQTLEAMDFVNGQILAANQACDKSLCHLLHSDIKKVSEKLYRDGSYAEAACNAFIEINSRLKELYHTARPDSENIPDGQTLMNKIFADNDPVLEAGDRTTQTGKDIHAGTRFLFAGAMAALRNPKSHENITLEKDESMRRLVFASMLMFKIDEIVADLGEQ